MDNVKKILSCAGSDSGGGAGIQADIKTISAYGAYAMTAVTAVTAQNTLGISKVEAVSPSMFKAQLESVFSDLFPDAVKTGMMMCSENVRTAAEIFGKYGAANIVCDPVISSTSGRTLLDNEGINALKGALFPLCSVITPNIPEAEILCGIKIDDISGMKRAAILLSEMSGGAVLIKGGHLKGNADDVLYCEGKFYIYEGRRIDNPNTHGTGCTLSSAIACGLAEDLSVPEAVEKAKKYIERTIGAGLDLGSGNGPLWHLV